MHLGIFFWLICKIRILLASFPVKGYFIFQFDFYVKIIHQEKHMHLCYTAIDRNVRTPTYMIRREIFFHKVNG
ncbi:hypothetical protein PRUPE_4G061500 [Prunus persica]|uniref:Uncharacterized protein n=1 Tax=Prunus persica TaxID=3760 RepID=M5X7Y5_PRUPE|nr:hypothetical protein PRUPE_4G061500 [Prunus persica]